MFFSFGFSLCPAAISLSWFSPLSFRFASVDLNFLKGNLDFTSISHHSHILCNVLNKDMSVEERRVMKGGGHTEDMV